MSLEIISALYLFMVLSIMVVIIGENRNPLKALPWLLVVLFVPVVGVILYIFFGEDLRHTYLINRKVYRRLSIVPNELSERELHHMNSEADSTMKLVQNNSNSPLLSYQSIEIFTDGANKFARLKADLVAAKEYIHLQYYAFEDDELGTEIAKILIAKAHEGVAVRILYDDVGSWSTKRTFWMRMRKEGVQVYPFMRVIFPILSSRVNYRNHRKLVIIDSRIGYIGGMNIADRYVKGDNLGTWRDTHFRITGAALAELDSSFLMDWYLVTRRVVSNISQKYLRMFAETSALQVREQPRLQLVKGTPTGVWRTIEQSMIALMMRATRLIRIETPYFLPTGPLSSAISVAALSGVEVEIIIPERGDSSLVQAASHSYVDALLDAGVKVYQYGKGFLHSKFITVDNEVSMIGSTNMDFRSLEHNFEIAAILYDAETAQALNRIFDEDRAESRLVLKESWRKRSRIKRFSESVSRLFSPLL